jgi:hypothetical protein
MPARFLNLLLLLENLKETSHLARTSISRDSPRTGAAAAPANLLLGPSSRPPTAAVGSSLLVGQLSSSSLSNGSLAEHASSKVLSSSPHSPVLPRRRRSHSGVNMGSPSSNSKSGRKSQTDASTALAQARSRSAQKTNDAMVYLDGPQVYTCAQCRTHFTSHDEIISKSFHGKHGKATENLKLTASCYSLLDVSLQPFGSFSGRAYLFDQCVNITIGPAEDRMLITGPHSVCDIFCKRCKTLVGWTYAKAYEASQKYKEGKFIIEKINLHLEESDYYDVAAPAGERTDRFRARSISWGSDCPSSPRHDIIYEYLPSSTSASSQSSRDRQGSVGSPPPKRRSPPPVP